MTDELDAALAGTAPVPESARSTATARPCKRHQWVAMSLRAWDGTMAPVCSRCGKPKDITRSRRGTSSRRLGNDQERRAERRYGWEKVGEYGQATDLRGRMFKVQMKATRRAAPSLWRDVFAALEQTRDGRVPLLLLSFVHVGKPAEDFVVIRGTDWLDLHGRDEPEDVL